MGLKIIALLTVRNEARYMEACLKHLVEQGVEVCVIDNESTDETRAIAKRYLGKGVCRLESLEYPGYFALADILTNEERLARDIKADWFVHHDADEIRCSPDGMGTMQEAIFAVDKAGYNAINFDEFVFLPSENCSEGIDYQQKITDYYHFSPKKLHRVNAWKSKVGKVDLVSSGGHGVAFASRKIYPRNFILKHYIGLSRRQLIRKYAGRVFSAEEMYGKSWHGARAVFSPSGICWPGETELKDSRQSKQLETDQPFSSHPFLLQSKPRKINNYIELQELRQSHSGYWAKCKEWLACRSLFPANPFPVPFVVGVMRSGTTLLRLMLDAHPDLAIPSETRFFPAIEPLLEQEVVTPGELMSVLAAVITWPDFELDRGSLQMDMEEQGIKTLSDGLSFFYKAYARRFGKTRWGDKTPYYGLHIDQILGIVPAARFIHIVRDGRDVCLSTKGLWFGLGATLEEQAANWMNNIRQTRQLAQLAPFYMEVRYEDLLREPEKVLKGICRFLHLKYTTSMLNYHLTSNQRLSEFKARVDENGNEVLSKNRRLDAFKLVSEPPQINRIGQWRQALSVEQIKIFEEVAGEMLQDLGYPLMNDRKG